MQKLLSPPLAGGYLRSAFESCCGALRALEYASAQAASEDGELQRPIAGAIASLREAIDELRSIRDSNTLAAGFILPSEPPSETAEPHS